MPAFQSPCVRGSQQVTKMLQQPSMMRVYERSSDTHTFLSALGGLVGSQRPDIAALIRQHFTTFSNFIHCQMHHLLFQPARGAAPAPEAYEDDASSTPHTIEETTQFLCANSCDDVHSKPFPMVPQVCAHTPCKATRPHRAFHSAA